MTDDFSDSLDNLFEGDTGPAREIERPAAREYVARTTAPGYVQKCWKCSGTGQTRWGACFACRGAGGKTFKTSPEARAKATQQRADRKARSAAESLAAFEAEHPVVWAWIKANAQKFDFATKMVETIVNFGSLTPGQLAACQRCADRDVQKAAERTQRVQQAPQVASEGIDRLKAAFDRAVAYSAEKGLKLSPRITVAGTTISPAKAHSANPGALYVKAGQTYLGKISGGQFFASRDCSAEQQAKVLAFVADPAEAAKVYGQTTGTCCVCNATLRSEWKHRGIGPVCAEKFGW
jgi:hypothetical protein